MVQRKLCQMDFQLEFFNHSQLLSIVTILSHHRWIFPKWDLICIFFKWALEKIYDLYNVWVKSGPTNVTYKLTRLKKQFQENLSCDISASGGSKICLTPKNNNQSIFVLDIEYNANKIGTNNKCIIQHKYLSVYCKEIVFHSRYSFNTILLLK